MTTGCCATRGSKEDEISLEEKVFEGEDGHHQNKTAKDSLVDDKSKKSANSSVLMKKSKNEKKAKKESSKEDDSKLNEISETGKS